MLSSCTPDNPMLAIWVRMVGRRCRLRSRGHFHQGNALIKGGKGQELITHSISYASDYTSLFRFLLPSQTPAEQVPVLQEPSSPHPRLLPRLPRLNSCSALGSGIASVSNSSYDIHTFTCPLSAFRRSYCSGNRTLTLLHLKVDVRLPQDLRHG